MSRLETFEPPRWMTRRLGIVTACVGALLAYGAMAPRYPAVALGVALIVLIIGFTLLEPATIPLLSMPLLVIVQRVGSDTVNLTVSDLALFAAFWAAMALGPRPYSRPMQTMLWLAGAYQVATLFTVLANPYRANTVEWFHAWLLVGGALVVGWFVGRSGHARLGLALLVVPCLALALLTCVQGAIQLAAGSTGPVYLSWPYGMHKNFIGCILAVAALVIYVNPPWLAWPRAFVMPAFALTVLGILASQSRQALVGLAVAIAFVFLRADRHKRRSRIVFLSIFPAIWYAFSVVHAQLASGDQFNSAYQRLGWYQDSLIVWARNEWFGAGLRWWTSGRAEFTFQPPNAEMEVLSSAGVIGLLGFLVLMIGALVVLWRLNPRYGTLALAIVGMRLVQGQLDLFWVAVQVSVPFTIAGLCLGAAAAEAGGKRTVGRRNRSFPVPEDTGDSAVLTSVGSVLTE